MDSDMSGNDKEVEDQAVEGEGEPKDSTDEINESHEPMGNDLTGDPLYVQKRLKQQKRSHDREMRDMQARMAEMQSQMSNQSQGYNPTSDQQGNMNPNVDETISRAVSFALRQKEEDERKAKAAEAASSVSKEYGKLQTHLDSLSDKYDDFDDVVRSDSAPFTATMRDAALMLPKKGAGSAGEVLYKLGKNPEELARISKLYPHEQASELIALSHALVSGGEQKGSAPKHLGQIKSNPVTNSVGVTEKTSPSQIRAMMKAGKFK